MLLAGWGQSQRQYLVCVCTATEATYNFSSTQSSFSAARRLLPPGVRQLISAAKSNQPLEKKKSLRQVAPITGHFDKTSSRHLWVLDPGCSKVVVRVPPPPPPPTPPCVTATQPLTHLSATVSAAERQILNETALFRRSDQQTVVCALLLSEIWYFAMFSTCIVYFIAFTVRPANCSVHFYSQKSDILQCLALV